jgi:hypothetical protein
MLLTLYVQETDRGARRVVKLHQINPASPLARGLIVIEVTGRNEFDVIAGEVALVFRIFSIVPSPSTSNIQQLQC